MIKSKTENVEKVKAKTIENNMGIHTVSPISGSGSPNRVDLGTKRALSGTQGAVLGI